MTLPDERYRALVKAKKFLRALLDPKLTPKVPRHIRTEAYWVLKHYPGFHELEHIATAASDLLEVKCKEEDV